MARFRFNETTCSPPATKSARGEPSTSSAAASVSNDWARFQHRRSGRAVPSPLWYQL